MVSLLDQTIRAYPADEQPAGLLVAAGVVRRLRPDPRGGRRLDAEEKRERARKRAAKRAAKKK